MQDCLSQLWYDVNFSAAWASLTLGFSLRTEGSLNMPDRGPALLIANHQSFLDPLAIGLAARRRLCYLARKTLFTNPVFGAFLHSVGSVPVDQEGVAKEGLKTVLELLRAGKPVLVFPEGERTWTGQMQPLKPGIHLLIKRAGVPIVPVGVAGAYDALPRTRTLPTLCPLFWPAGKGSVAVSIGRPLPAERYQGLSRDAVLGEMFKEIHAVQQRAERLRRKM